MGYEYQGFASLSVNLNRQKYGALDISQVFNSQADLDYYISKGAATEGVSDYWKAVTPYPYAGQYLALVNNDTREVKAYILVENENGTFATKEVGSAPIGDEQSIEIVDGKVQIKGFNAHYYAYSVDEDGTSKYTKTEGFKEGLEPKVIKRLDENGSVVTDTEGNPIYDLAWFEPSTTTVEGLNSTVETLRQEVANKADKATTLAGYGITDAYTKTEIADLIASAGHLERAIVATLPEVSAADAETIYMVKVDGVEGDAYKEYMLIDGALVQIGDTSVNLDGYVTDDALAELLKDKVDKNGTDRLITEEEAAIIEKLKNLTGNEQVNVIDGVSNEFSISDDGKTLSIKEIAQDKVTGLADALDGKVDKVEGSRLMTEAEGNKLFNIEGGAQANKIEVIKINGVEVEITDKAVDLPLATAAAYGMVKGSADENKVSVGEDGTMEVNSLNVNKLVQNEEDTLILNGGGASI